MTQRLAMVVDGGHVPAGAVALRGLVKRFDDVTAVDGLDLTIAEHEFFTLLGPSGCGKTTTLRIIAGLERPDAGEVRLGDRILAAPARDTFVPPERRDMGMVFQAYALWPHMTVFENVAYPLRVRRFASAEIGRAVREALRVVGLAGLEDRPSPLLSGGQQQRVALARAIVFSPKVLLLDEPLSSLDAKLREEMRRELKTLQRTIDVTVVYVTHDQVEALSLSDRVGIMRAGRLEQVGTPEEIYARPASPYVQQFLGKTLVLGATVRSVRADGTELTTGSGQRLRLAPAVAERLVAGQEVEVAIRPEHVRVSAMPSSAPNVITATVQSSLFLGDQFEYTVRIDDRSHVLTLPATERFEPGAQLFLELPAQALLHWTGPAPGTETTRRQYTPPRGGLP